MDRYFVICTIFLLFNSCYNINIEVGDEYKLPEPQKEGGMGIYEALNLRKSSRDFNATYELTDELLSQALWSCYGMNDENHRTVPSGKGWYPYNVYVFRKDGVYQYLPETHVLTKLKDGDHREITGRQTELVTSATVDIVFIGDLKKPFKVEDLKIKHLAVKFDSGHVTMVLSLFAAANNLKGVVRRNFDSYSILQFLGLDSNNYEIAISYSLGN